MVEHYDFNPPVEVPIRCRVVAEAHGIGACSLCEDVGLLERLSLLTEVGGHQHQDPLVLQRNGKPLIVCDGCADFIHGRLQDDD